MIVFWFVFLFQLIYHLVALLTQLEEAVSVIVVYFKETTAPTRPLTPTNPSATQPNFSQVLVTNLTRSNSPTPPQATNSPTHITNNVTNNTTRNNNMYSNSQLLTVDSPYTSVNVTPTYRHANASPTLTNAKLNETRNNNAAAAIAAAAAATNAKKLNALVRGKFCTALVGVLANGLRKQLHILSLREPHVS
jgi:hypothetical protein